MDFQTEEKKILKLRENRLVVSLVILALWVVGIEFGQQLAYPNATSLDDLVTTQINSVLVVIALLLLGAVLYLRWPRPVGLKAAEPARSWLLLWLPLLIILLLLGFAAIVGLPPTTVVLLVLINTLIVGVEEELMFRGILLTGLLSRLNIWPMILLSSLLFGSVHALNGFITGNFTAAFIQALQATLSGVWLMSVRLRTRSIYPAMLIHGLWDFSVFLLGRAAAGSRMPDAAAASLPLTQQLMFGILVPLPLFLYGLWLLRGIGKQTKAEILGE